MRISTTVLRTTAALLLALLLHPATACSCMNPGDTGDERAANIRRPNGGGELLFFVGRVLNKTSYDDIDEDGYELTYQDVSFSLEETLFNSAADGSFPSNVHVGNDGTTTVETSTVTTCCLCGLKVRGSIGTKYLVSLSGGRSLSACGFTCRINDTLLGSSLCADTVAALRIPQIQDPPMVTINLPKEKKRWRKKYRKFLSRAGGCYTYQYSKGGAFRTKSSKAIRNFLLDLFRDIKKVLDDGQELFIKFEVKYNHRYGFPRSVRIIYPADDGERRIIGKVKRLEKCF